MAKALENPRVDRDSLEDIWRRFVREFVDVEVIFEEQDAPRPKPPYISINIISGPTAPNPDDILFLKSAPPLPAKAIHTQEGERRYTVSLKSFASRKKKKLASNMLDILHSAVRSEPGKLLLRGSDIAIIDRGSPANISLPLEDGFEARYNMDIIFSTVQSFDVDVSVIEKVSIGGTLNKDEPNEITVPPSEIEAPP